MLNYPKMNLKQLVLPRSVVRPLKVNVLRSLELTDSSVVDAIYGEVSTRLDLSNASDGRRLLKLLFDNIPNAYTSIILDTISKVAGDHGPDVVLNEIANERLLYHCDVKTSHLEEIFGVKYTDAFVDTEFHERISEVVETSIKYLSCNTLVSGDLYYGILQSAIKLISIVGPEVRNAYQSIIIENDMAILLMR